MFASLQDLSPFSTTQVFSYAASNLQPSSTLNWNEAMSNHSDTSSIYDETGAIGIDITASEIAKLIVSGLIGMAVAVGIIAVVMLL